MIENRSSYRQIIKATSLLGSVQVVNIIVQILRSKIIAVLLGPTGIGIITLINSNLQLIGSLTNLGLNTSAVKVVAEANSLNDNNRIATVVTVLQRWVRFTGIVGSIIIVGLSRWLSEISFGNADYAMAFVWVSITLFFNQISAGQLVVLQGLRKLNYLANASVTGSVIGLIVSIPLYYYYSFDGIVPAIIVTSLANMLRSWYFAQKVSIPKVNISWSRAYIEGKEMLYMGIALSMSGFVANGAMHILRIFISNTGGVEDVGLYGAGFAIINNYVGLIFTAMGTDYYPRLAEFSSNNNKLNELVNQQAEIAILAIAPLLLIFLVFIDWIVNLLYSNQFVGINIMIQWTAIGMFFKSASWSVSFVFLAKSHAKYFFWNEVVAIIYTLMLNIVGYKYAGLRGIGISFLISYTVYFLQVYYIANNKYQISFNLLFKKMFMIQFSLGAVCLLLVLNTVGILLNTIGIVLIIISSFFSIYELNKRVGLYENLKKLLQKR